MPVSRYRNSLDLARHVEALGYQRYWMAEHHNLQSLDAAKFGENLASHCGVRRCYRHQSRARTESH